MVEMDYDALIGRDIDRWNEVRIAGHDGDVVHSSSKCDANKLNRQMNVNALLLIEGPAGLIVAANALPLADLHAWQALEIREEPALIRGPAALLLARGIALVWRRVAVMHSVEIVAGADPRDQRLVVETSTGDLGTTHLIEVGAIDEYGDLSHWVSPLRQTYMMRRRAPHG